MGAARGSTSVSETFFLSESEEHNCLECKKGINVFPLFHFIDLSTCII